jgi:anti-sigma-K factor RskA
MAEPNDEDAAFRALAALWDRRLAEAGEALEAEAPSAQVWDRISARVDQLEAAQATRTVAADDGVWHASSPGVWRKLLHVDAAAGWQAMLVRIEAGASVPPHAHPMLEECLVLEGEFELAGETVGKGDLHLAFPGQDHAPIFSRAGALLYIRAGID